MQHFGVKRSVELLYFLRPNSGGKYDVVTLQCVSGALGCASRTLCSM
jgi:hypothetical protein